VPQTYPVQSKDITVFEVLNNLHNLQQKETAGTIQISQMKFSIKTTDALTTEATESYKYC
jgi:hypothetical protein